MSRALAGSCVVPIGAYAEPGPGALRLRGFVASLDGTRAARGELTAANTDADPEAAGQRLAEQLEAAGAREILAALPALEAGGALMPFSAARHVLVARLRRQAQASPSAVSARRRRAAGIPVLQIEPVAPDAQARGVLRALGAGLAVFISANAVEHGPPLVRAAGGWPADSDGGRGRCHRRRAAGTGRGPGAGSGARRGQ